MEQLYWLTLNGTVHVYTLAKRLLTAGFVAQMLPFLVFCVKALDQHIIFSTARYDFKLISCSLHTDTTVNVTDQAKRCFKRPIFYYIYVNPIHSS